MNRRYLLLAGGAAVVCAVTPPRAALTPTLEVIEWLRTLRSLTYDERRAYVASLRKQRATSARFVELVDLIEDMNERGSFV